MTIKAILFDFFGVISLSSHKLFFETAIPGYEHRHAEFEALGRQHELGLISVEQYLHAIAQATGLTVEQCLQHMHGERDINQPLLHYIRDHLKTHYHIGMVSNAGGDLSGYIEQNLWQELFDEVIISSDVGLIKPDPAIYQLACRRLGVEPDQAVMIDDSQPNCDGAQQAGLQTILYTSNAQVKQELKRLLYT